MIIKKEKMAQFTYNNMCSCYLSYNSTCVLPTDECADVTYFSEHHRE